MPTLETIRRLKMEATTTGVTQATAELNKLSAAQTDVAKTSQVMGTVTDQTSRKQLSVEAAYKRQTLALDEAARKQDQYAKAARVADQALAQGVITQEQHAERLGTLSAKYEQASTASKAFAQATSGVSAQLIAMSAGAGPVGVFLSALGPWGLAAAVGLGAVVSAIQFVVAEANRMGDKAIAIRQFTEATGLTAAQFKGIRHEAAAFGIEGDTTAAAFERLTFQLDETRQGAGKLFEEIREVDKGLADQLARTTTTADAIDLLAQAYKAATSEAQKMAIARAAFGRQGAVIGPALGGIAEAGGVSNLHAVTEATDEQTRSRAKLRAGTIELQKETKNLYATMGTDAVLKAENDLAKYENRIARITKETAAARNEFSLFQRIMMAIAQSSASMEPGSVLPAMQGLGPRSFDFGDLNKATEQTKALSDAMQKLAEPAAVATKTLKELQDAAALAANEERQRVSLLGEAATVQEKATSSLLSLTEAFLKGKLGAEDYERAVDAVNHAAQALTATHDAAIQTLQARTAAEREAAAAASVRASDSSGDAELRAQQAVTMEIEKQKAAHEDAMAAMRGQLAVAQAVTGAEKIAAQEQATFNDLIRQGRTEEQALAEAAMQTAIAHANANTAVEQTIKGLKQELEVLKATTQESKDRVLAEQAYQNAIDSGADVEHAMRLQAATEAISEEKRRQAEDNARLKAQDEQRLALLKQMVAAENEYSAAIERIYSGQDRLINQMDNMQFAIPSGGTRDTGIPWGPGKVSWFGPTAPGGTGPSNFDPITNKFTDSIETDALQKQKEAFEISRVQAQISGDKGAEINAVQGELNFYKGQPQTLENLNQIKSLMDALTELTKATEDNTAATATISDIYASGHSARIGYYAEGQTTQTIGQPTITNTSPVWGNPMTTPAPANSNVPRSPMWAPYAGIQHFAEGGTVTRPTLALVGEAGPEDITPVGKRGGPPTVVQNFNIMMPARSDLGDRSTQRQMFEGVGRRAAVAR
jgi:hypothetical protein